MSARTFESIREDLLERIKRMPVVDTHEHMMSEAQFVARDMDFATIMTYCGIDLGLAGMDCGGRDSGQFAVRAGKDAGEKWSRMARQWPYVRTGAFARCYRRMLKMFFDADDLDERVALEVTDRIKTYQRPGIYKELLQQRFGIRVMQQVWDQTPHPEPQYFAPIYYISSLCGAYSRQDAAKALGADLPIHLDEYRELLRGCIRTAAANGAVGLKIGMTARHRDLDFREHSPESAQASYDYLRSLQGGGDPRVEATRERLRPFHDTAYWDAFAEAGALGLPVQVHSGMMFPQPWDGRPSALIRSIQRFPETKFAIFHGSYPHMADLAGLAKSFPNVYLDLAWFFLVSQTQARLWLAEWLDAIPHNKIFAFGGDVFNPFELCAHLEIVRENVAHVLAERVHEGLCDLDEAAATAQWLFHDNPWNAFKFEGR